MTGSRLNERSRNWPIVERCRSSARPRISRASASRPSAIEFSPASSSNAMPDIDCTAPSCNSFASRRRSSCSAVISWSESRDLSASRTCACASTRAFACSRAAKSASTVARTRSSRSNGRLRVSRIAPISSSRALIGITTAFSAGALRGRSPGCSKRAFASNSRSACAHVSPSTLLLPAICAIESTSDSRKRASLVSSSSAASWRRRSVTIRYAANETAAATAAASPTAVSATEATASPTTVTTAAAPNASANAPALVDDRFAKRNRNRLRPRVRLELGQDVADVTLDRLLADEQLRSDVLIRHAVREQLQDLALAPGEHLVLVLAGQEGGHQGGIDIALTRGNLLDRAQERLVRSLFQDVTLRARL